MNGENDVCVHSRALLSQEMKLSFAGKWMEPETMTLSKISETQKKKKRLYVFSHVWKLKEKIGQLSRGAHEIRRETSRAEEEGQGDGRGRAEEVLGSKIHQITLWGFLFLLFECWKRNPGVHH